MLNEVRKFELRKKYLNSNSFFDPLKFDFQIPAGLNFTKSVVCMH